MYVKINQNISIYFTVRFFQSHLMYYNINAIWGFKIAIILLFCYINETSKCSKYRFFPKNIIGTCKTFLLGTLLLCFYFLIIQLGIANKKRFEKHCKCVFIKPVEYTI